MVTVREVISIPKKPKIPLTPTNASVNRVTIVDLPGIPVDAEVRGRKAYHLFSTLALIEYAQQYKEALGFPAAYTQATAQTRRALPRFVDACLHGTDLPARRAAQAIAQRLGRNMGHILLALHRGDAVNQAARSDWREADWARWTHFRRIYVGGGAMSGALGRLIVQAATSFLAEAGYAVALQVRRAAYPAHMSLVGAGRYAPAGSRDVLCLDFGHTLVKPACLRFEAGALAQMQTFAPLPVPWDWSNDPAARENIDPAEVMAFVVQAVLKAYEESRAVGGLPGSDVMISLAAYVRDGHLLGNGLYATMSTLSEDVRPLLAASIAARVGYTVHVHPIHDGTAAAAMYAGEPNAVVFIMGTAIGVGFPPDTARHLRPLVLRGLEG